MLDAVGSAVVQSGAVGLAHLWDHLAAGRESDPVARRIGPEEAGRRTDAS